MNCAVMGCERDSYGAGSLCEFHAKRVGGSWQSLARKAVAFATRCGWLPEVRMFSCVDCGKKAEQWDHRDYSRPLDVEPVCRGCNAKRGPAQTREFDMAASLTEEQLRKWTRKELTEWNSQEEYAQANGMSAAYLSDFLSGKRGPGAKMLEALGFERVVMFRRRRSCATKSRMNVERN